MKRNEIIELTITDYAFEGKGIAKIAKEDNNQNFVVFVNGAYPGDVVKARIIKVKKKFAIANVEKILKASENRIAAKCKYFGVCGGCKQQDLKYERQIYFKHKQVEEIYERIGGLKDFNSNQIIPSENIFNYRNKMEFSFSNKRWLTPHEIKEGKEITDRNFALGLHVPKVFDKVLDITECYLQPDINNKIINLTRDFFKAKKTSVYSTKSHQGYLRNLVLRNSTLTDDLMVNLVTSEENTSLMKEFSKLLKDEIPEVTTFVNNINVKKSQVAIGDYEKVYLGTGFIFDFIGKYKFRISSNSFFQTNTIQAERLYLTALNSAELSGNEIVYDLYSGAGTISIFISESSKKVIGFESVESATLDAEYNVQLNGINNVEFVKADLNKSFLPIVNELKLPKPDVIIADPPRSGMNPKTIKNILELLPQKIIYISCNPATQARDIKTIVETGKYKLLEITPVDMFPHTFHIENVAKLERQ